MCLLREKYFVPHPFYKIQYRCEFYDYLFDIAAQMRQCGLDPAQRPSSDQSQPDEN